MIFRKLLERKSFYLLEIINLVNQLVKLQRLPLSFQPDERSNEFHCGATFNLPFFEQLAAVC